MEAIFSQLVQKKIEKVSGRERENVESEEHVVLSPSVEPLKKTAPKKQPATTLKTTSTTTITSVSANDGKQRVASSSSSSSSSSSFWKSESVGGGAAGTDPILRKALKQLDNSAEDVAETAAAAATAATAGGTDNAKEGGKSTGSNDFFLPDTPSVVGQSKAAATSKSTKKKGSSAAGPSSSSSSSASTASAAAVSAKKQPPVESAEQKKRRLLKQREARAKQTSLNAKLEVERDRRHKFETLLTDKNVDVGALRKLAWTGAPDDLRGPIWRLLCGYLPTNLDRRQETLNKKRSEYLNLLPRYLNGPENERTHAERKTWQQITIDMPRTHTELPLFQQDLVQTRLRRMLYVWALRHPASGYVQGMNDLATPFLLVFLAEALHMNLRQTEQLGSELPDLLESGQVDMNVIEADTFWCFSKLLDGIQDHYTRDQPGIQRMIFKLKELIHRVDAPLYEHLAAQNLEFNMFAFRWMNCLLLREFPLPFVVRMWDTYLSDEEGFSKFHVYVCASFLVRLSAQLKQLEFQDMLLLLHNYTYQGGSDFTIEELLSQAFVFSSVFAGSAYLK